jgi:hypothetical protein
MVNSMVVLIFVTMLARFVWRLRLPMACSLVAAMLLASTSSASAQDHTADDGERPSLLWDTAKAVALDHTTYAPAFLYYGTTRLDWNSSQVFFQHGMVEHNERFTISGRPDDVAISYGAGNNMILMDTLTILRMSAVNNVTNNLIERVLIARYLRHRKLLRTLGWIERTGFASYWSYRLSAGHYRQWRHNERVARQLGFR